MVHLLLLNAVALMDVYHCCVLLPLTAFTVLAVSLYLRRAASRGKEYSNGNVKAPVKWEQLLNLAKMSCALDVRDAVAREGLDVNSYTDKDTRLTLLLSACLGGSTELVRYLIEEGADCSALTVAGDTALILATFSCCSHKTSDPALIDLLACKGVNVNTRNFQGDTALHIAALHGSTRLISILLQYGADPTIANHRGVRAIHFAGHSGNLEASKAIERHINDHCMLEH